MARTSRIQPGLSHELGLGLNGFYTFTHGGGYFESGTQEVWSGGAQVGARFGYGFTDRVGIDFSAFAGLGGFHPDWEPGTLTSGVLALAGKCRPWTSNSLFMVEYDSEQKLVGGWVGGFPQHGEEKWSVSAMAGGASFELWRSTENLRMGLLRLGLARSFSRGSIRITPALTTEAGTGRRSNKRTDEGYVKVQLGVVVAPQPSYAEAQ